MNEKIVDLVALDEKNEIVHLIIMDEDTWDDPRQHIDALQEKVLTYVTFVENGTFYRKYPKAQVMGFMIKAVFLNKPNSEGEKFIEEIADVLLDTGYRFEYVVYEDA